MTLREKLKKEHPDRIDHNLASGCRGCPSDYGYDSEYNEEKNCGCNGGEGCEYCWDREAACSNPNYIPDVDKPHILDSGNRRQFETGAVRDICEGKGRCDLLPLDVVALVNGCGEDSHIIRCIDDFCKEGAIVHLCGALEIFTELYFKNSMPHMFLELAKHFEEGCKKYGDNNWQKGIPTHCYIDSAVRHYLKYLRGDKDEPHDRAFCWNILCCIWTCVHKPELNDYAPKEERDEQRS